MTSGPELLTSRANPRVRAAAALLTAAGRKNSGRFLLEGARLCADAVETGVPVETCFATPAAAEKYAAAFARLSAAAETVFLIGDGVSEKLSDTRAPQGIYCVCRRAERPFRLTPDGFYVMTDGLQNPENLGALARTAEALGAAGLIVAGGCDVYAPKALRASMGSLLRLPVSQPENAADAVRGLQSQGLRVYAAALTPDAAPVTEIAEKKGCAVVVGNEGSGVGEAVLRACDGRVIIPMRGRAESLNAAAAAAILIWEFTK